MKRALLLGGAVIAMAIGVAAQAGDQEIPERFGTASHTVDVVEATIYELQDALTDGRVTSRELVQKYLDRINRYEDRVNATAAISESAMAEATFLDRERAAGRVRGPLHGIPIGIKDIINTTSMPTTGGGLAFAGFAPPYDAPLIKNLRDAGAIIFTKTVLTEFANWVAAGMPANYSGLFGYGYNPYDPRPDPREGLNDGRPAMGTGGSSSGIGTTLSFWAGSVGTETSGSILSPSNQNMLVGIKPTVGLISRYGIAPITADQDTAGPMTRTVADAAIMLSALVGADPNDPATDACLLPPGRDYTRFLRLAGLKGARIGIPRAGFYRPVNRPDTGAAVGGLNARQLAVMEEAIAIMKREGAEIVDPADIPSYVDGTPANNFNTWPICAGPTNNKGNDAACSTVFKYGMKRDFNLWLASLGAGAPVKTLTELRNYNLANQPRGAIKYGQAHFDVSDEMDLEADRARYLADRARDIFVSRTHGIDEAMDVHKLDALIFPGSSGAGIAAKAGHPTVIVPFGFVPNAPAGGTPAFPAGFNPKDQPYGVSFTGTACTEPRLIELAYAFEQATRRRVPPPDFP
jgi:amidase